MVRFLFTALSFLVGLAAFVVAAPTPISKTLDARTLTAGIHFESGNPLPLLTLPYATYRAVMYDVSQDVSEFLSQDIIPGLTDLSILSQYYLFKNIRFATAPIGALRWRPPAAPPTESVIQDGSVGYQCLQATPQQFGSMFCFPTPSHSPNVTF